VRIFEIAVLVIAAVQDSAVGGGVGLACAADFRVASVGGVLPGGGIAELVAAGSLTGKYGEVSGRRRSGSA
jgi:enoyl-CoA hydratase/carnithine racemase